MVETISQMNHPPLPPGHRLAITKSRLDDQMNSGSVNEILGAAVVKGTETPALKGGDVDEVQAPASILTESGGAVVKVAAPKDTKMIAWTRVPSALQTTMTRILTEMIDHGLAAIAIAVKAQHTLMKVENIAAPGRAEASAVRNDITINIAHPAPVLPSESRPPVEKGTSAITAEKIETETGTEIATKRPPMEVLTAPCRIWKVRPSPIKRPKKPKQASEPRLCLFGPPTTTNRAVMFALCATRLAI
jgi:hypothetical protein